LNDWDLCKYKEDLNSGATQRGRSGTWQFMSAVLLASPGTKAHEVADDIESFIHVIVWLSLRFHAHRTLIAEETIRLIEYIYDHRWNFQGRPGVVVGGYGKLDWITKGEPPVQIYKNPPLSGLLSDLALLCQQHYRTIDTTSFKRPKLEVDQDDEESVLPIDGLGEVTLPASSSDIIISDGVGYEPSREVVAEPTLSNHVKILETLRKWLQGSRWWRTKGDDVFDQFPYSGKFGSSDKPGSKRKSSQMDATVDAPEAKKPKRSTHRSSHAELDVIAENVENVET